MHMKMKVFFDLACMSTCCWGLPKPKYEPFITNNRGTLKDRRSVSSRSHKFCSHSITGNLFLRTRELPRFAGSVLMVYHSLWGPLCSTGRGYVSLGRASLTMSYEPSCELWTEMEPKKQNSNISVGGFIDQMFSAVDSFGFLHEF